MRIYRSALGTILRKLRGVGQVTLESVVTVTEPGSIRLIDIDSPTLRFESYSRGWQAELACPTLVLLTRPATVRPEEGDHYLVAKAISCNQRGNQVGCKPEDGDPA